MKITRSDGHWFVQGHSRSPIFVPVQNPYATSYWWIILTYVLYRTVSDLPRHIGSNCRFWQGSASIYLPLLQWILELCTAKFRRNKLETSPVVWRTTYFEFSIHWTFRRQSRAVWHTDRRTDGQNYDSSSVRLQYQYTTATCKHQWVNNLLIFLVIGMSLSINHLKGRGVNWLHFAVQV